MEPQVFVQVLEPLGSVWVAAAVALLPLGVLLVCLAGLRISAWLAVLLCAAVTVALAVVVWDAPLDKTLMAYGLGSAHRAVVGGLDRVLGPGHLQHDGHHGRLRRPAGLAGDGRRSRRPGAGAGAGVGVRGAAGGPGRVRLPVGGRRADPHRAGHVRSRRAADGGAGQHGPGVQRSARRTDHRAGRRHRAAAARAVRVDRKDRCGPRDRTAVPVDLPGVGPRGAADGVAAGRRGGRGVHRGPAADVAVPGAVPAGRDRGAHLPRVAAAVPAGVDAGVRCPSARRPTCPPATGAAS